MIACTYTPYCIVSLRGVTGWVLFGIEWGLAIIGIVLTAIDLDRYVKASTVVYVLLGWAIVFVFNRFYEAISVQGVILLLIGGLLYTIGAVLYALGRKIRYMHSIFHLFVIAGSIMHFFSIYNYVI